MHRRRKRKCVPGRCSMQCQVSFPPKSNPNTGVGYLSIVCVRRVCVPLGRQFWFDVMVNEQVKFERALLLFSVQLLLFALLTLNVFCCNDHQNSQNQEKYLRPKSNLSECLSQLVPVTMTIGPHQASIGRKSMRLSSTVEEGSIQR